MYETLTALHRRIFPCLSGIIPLGVSFALVTASCRDAIVAAKPAALAQVSFPCARKRRRDPQAASADYSRFSTEMQHETTVESQQSDCRHLAVRDGQPIDLQLEYVDRAVSGATRDRDGLNALLRDAEAGRFNRLYFFSLSRLARELIIGMSILKRLVYVLKIRVISVSEGLDTDREGWENLAQSLFSQHERYLKELSANTLRGQKLNIKNNFSNGDYCFGYTSLPVPGSEQTRRGRNALPRMVYAIDPIKSVWVPRIFVWFVTERRSIRWIVRELNRLGAPKDHRATTPLWRHQYVTGVLENRKYVGDWPWGEMRNLRDPVTGVMGQEPRPAEEAEVFRRSFAELRLIDDETFQAAQQILNENRLKALTGRNDDGEFVAGRDGAAPPTTHLLGGLIVCGHPTDVGLCGRTFYVGGSRGKFLCCPGHLQGTCNCRTMLPRQLAENLILEQIGKRILENPAWLQAVFNAVHSAWIRRRRMLPDELRDVRTGLDKVNRIITRLLDVLEGNDHPAPDVLARLGERRAERTLLEQRLAAAQAVAAEQPVEPSPDWVRAKLEQLGATLINATPAAAHALHDLVGGRIIVEEIPREGKKRHFLRGTFEIRVGGITTALGLAPITGSEPVDAPYETITVDFKHADPRDVLCEQAKALWDEKLLYKEIALRLDCSEAFVPKLLERWSQRHGIELPDGRTRRGQIPPSPDALPLYQQIVGKVMELYHQDQELGDIAAALGHDRHTVTAAVGFWHESRGLTMPDGRTRRKSLPHSQRAGDEHPPRGEPNDSSAA